MIGSRSFLFVIVLALAAAGSAKAFQESDFAPSTSVQAPAPPVTDDPSLDLAPSDDSDPSALPNLDFGLELLYGSKSTAPAGGGSVDDDSGLKGRLTHTF